MTPIERDHARGLNGALAAEIRAELAVQDQGVTWLARATNMDRLTLRRYVKAERAMNTALVEVIAEALGLDAGELMARAVSRRDRHPELYGPEAAALQASILEAAEQPRQDELTDEEQAHVDRALAAFDDGVRKIHEAARSREAMQQVDDVAARDESTGA